MASPIGLGLNPSDNNRQWPRILSKEQLQRWHQSPPSLPNDCVEGTFNVSLKPEVDVSTESLGIAGNIRAKWDKVSLKVLPRLSKPSQIIGLLITIIGICGCITAISGFEIPGLELILRNIPVSIVFSLTLIRAGLHMLNNGVLAGRLINRTRQEADQYYRLLRIENNIEGVSPEEMEKRLAETHRRDQRLLEQYRLAHQLQAHQLYAKQNNDLAPIRPFLKAGLPELSKPVGDTFEVTLEMPKEITLPKEDQKVTPPPLSFGDKWNNFWYNHLETIGKIDMVVGQMMLFTALAGILFLAMPGIAPPGLSIIANDPYLSAIFVVLLIGNWINCTRTGWRMINFKKREEKRAAIEEDLKLIDAGLEVRYYLEAFGKGLEQSKETELTKRLIELTARAKAAINRPEDNEKGRLDHFGKALVPHLATPSIIMGILIAFFGAACLGMCISGNVPDIFYFLTKNTPLSVLFSSGILLVGLDGIYRGASISDLGKKEKWKEKSVNVRQNFLRQLYSPWIQEPASKTEPHESKKVMESIEVPKPPGNNNAKAQGKIHEFLNRLAKGWYGIWFKSLKGLWIPDGILGLFLITCSIMGLCVACGAPAPRALDFIVKDPSYSGTFCVSMLGIGFDALNSSWRMLNYKNRKDDDKNDLRILRESYKKLFPDRNSSMAPLA